VSTIDLATRTKNPDDITVDQHPNTLAMTPDGTFVYSANFDGGDVSTIDVATRSAGDQDVTVGTAPAGIAFTPCASTPEPPPAPPDVATPVVVTPAFTG
jgi:YVTN family beta-propeller protein